MNKYFSLSLYKEGLKRVRGVGIASALIVIVGNLILPINRVVRLTSFAVVYHMEVYADKAMAACPIMALLAPIIVLRMFSFLNKRSSSDFYHAIPQKRISLYLSFTAAAVTWIAGIIVVCGGACLIAWNIPYMTHLAVGEAMRSVFSNIALALLTSGCALLGAAIAGNVFSAVFASAMIFGLPAIVLNFFGSLIEQFYPPLVLGKTPFRFFGSKGFLPVASTEDFYNPKGLPVIAAYVAFLLLAALAAFAFVKRKSETAEHSTCTPVLQHLLRLSAAFPIWLLVINLVAAGDYLEAVPFVLVSLVVYVVYELITVRGIKNAVKVLPLFLILPVVSAVYAGGAYGCAAVMRANNPESADEVSYVEIESDIGEIQNLPLFKLRGEHISNPDAIAALTRDFDFYAEDNHYDFSSEVPYVGEVEITLKIVFKSGKVIYRYSYPFDEYAAPLVEAIKSDPAMFDKLLTLPEYDEISTTTPTKGWELFRKEYEKLSEEDKIRVFLCQMPSAANEYSICGDWVDEEGWIRSSFCFDVPKEYFPETAEYLERYYAEFGDGYYD